jgi:hypothetical protein
MSEASEWKKMTPFDFVKQFVDYDVTYTGDNETVTVTCEQPLTTGSFAQLGTPDGRSVNIGFTVPVNLEVGDEVTVSTETGTPLSIDRQGERIWQWNKTPTI